MDDSYKELHRSAEKLHFKFKDICDDRNNPGAQTIMSQGKEVVEDIERGKDPRAVESRIKTIQSTLRRMKSQPETFLSYNDIDTLDDGYEDLREDLRRHPKF